MNRDQKAAFIDEVAEQIRRANAIYAVDYRGLSVSQSTELRAQVRDAGASFRVVKNRLTKLACERAEVDSLTGLFEGPTALCFISDDGDPALAAKALASFRRQHQLPQFKGGTLNGRTLSTDEIESIARLPSRDVLQGQFVATLASPVTGLARALNGLLSGLAIQLAKISDQGLIGGESAAQASDGEARPSASEGSQAQEPSGDAGETEPGAEGDSEDAAQ